MEQSIYNLIGFAIHGTDGEIGEVKEFYFDDETWTIRYLVVETGTWLNERRVLIAPVSLLKPDWAKRIFPLNLTKEQIKHSPPIDIDKPVSRQQELDLYNHYPWGNYWGAGFYGGGMEPPASIWNEVLKREDDAKKKEIAGDRHLRSTKEVGDYDIEAEDGKFGKVVDFLVDDVTWKIDFIIVDTGNWLHGKEVLISPKWIKEINWLNSKVIMSASKDRIRNSPEYNGKEPASALYKEHLYNHYDRL